MTNTFWVTGNIIFDLDTGKTSQVLMLANNEGEASTFKQADADTYLSFVQRRAPLIKFSLHPSRQRPGQFVIKGIQDAD